jgi:hypothetical protein
MVYSNDCQGVCSEIKNKQSMLMKIISSIRETRYFYKSVNYKAFKYELKNTIWRFLA